MEKYQTISPFFLTEAAMYGDLIIADFMDTYKNISIKTFSVLAWKEKYCKNAAYVLRLTDDTVVNLTNLHAFADFDSRAKHDTTKRIYGSILTFRPVVRWTDYKWYVSEQEYPEFYFPSYCDGGACLYTKDAVTAILNQIPKTNYVWVDDVLYGGILAEGANVSRIDRCDLFGHFTIADYEKYLNHTYEPLNFIGVHVDDLTGILQTKYHFDNKW
uniref:Hexosyltransferase n=1 Tax=Panagrolaimus sp. JU765 TaxID=591449 RepID=A0AC34PVF7_9BILA